VADNTVINVGSGGDSIRDVARQGGAVKTQVVALDLGGVSGNPENLIAAGQALMAQSMPVALAGDQPSDPTLIKIADLLSQLLPAERGIWSPFEQLAQNIRSTWLEIQSIGQTSLNSGAITNPLATVITRPASAVSSAVTATSATPCVFTWTGHPLQVGQAVVLSGTTAPTGGNFVLGVTYWVSVIATNTFQLAATSGGASLSSTSTGTSLTVTLTYPPNSLIADSATSPGSHSFSIATYAGGCLIPRVRVVTNITSGWAGVNLLVTLWSAPPTYTGGDGGAYNPATGAANWLGAYLVILTHQCGDGAAGGGGLANANQASIKLASGTSVFVDIQMQNQANPIASQTFTVIPEILN
jgi:hypothetical protein